MKRPFKLGELVTGPRSTAAHDRQVGQAGIGKVIAISPATGKLDVRFGDGVVETYDPDQITHHVAEIKM
jgi:hypothetical protein